MKWAAEIAGGAARREISLCHCTSHRAATVATVATTTAYNDATPVAALATFPPPHCFDGGTSSLYAQYESDLNRNVPSVCISILTIRSAQYSTVQYSTDNTGSAVTASPPWLLQGVLTQVSRPTKGTLNRLGVFTVSSLHAYICAR